MIRRFKKFDPQLVVVEHTAGSAIALTNEAKLSLYKKSQKSGIPTNILETVYYRGFKIWNESFGQTPEQFAFDRVNSFIAGGFAADLDDDLITEDGKGYKNPTGGLTQKGRDHYNRTTGSHLKAPVTTPPSKLKAGSKSANRRKSFCARMGGMEGPMRKPNGEPTRKALALRKWNCEETELEEKRGLWDNIHAKQKRIKHGSGEHMRKPGSKGAPTDAALKASQNESADPCWTGYKQIGMKKKNGKPVPNCVPVKEEEETAGDYYRKNPPPKSAVTDFMNNNLPVISQAKAAVGMADKIKNKDYKGAALDALEQVPKVGIAVGAARTLARESFSKHKGKHFKNNETSEVQSHNPNDPESRFDGTTSGKNVYIKATPGQTIKRVVKEQRINMIRTSRDDI